MPKKSKKGSLRENLLEHSHFLVLLILVVGFATYSIVAFFDSINSHIDRSVASVTDSTEVEAPAGCITCPPYPVCSDYCAEQETDEEEVYQIFNDVDSNHTYAEAIEYLYFNGLITGYDDGTFKPENTVNRAEMLTMVTKAIDADLSGSGLSNCFSDVGEDWFAPFVCYAKNEGWVKGIDGYYRPAQTIIRAEALKIVLEASDLEVPVSVTDTMGFADVNTTDWFAPYVKVAVDNKIVDSGNFFGPSVNMTRGELADTIYRTFFK